MDCSSARLSNLVSEKEVDFDADIAGPGVLAAFLATSLIALSTLLSAYVTFSVPSEILNSGDAVMSSGIRHLLSRMSSKFPRLRRTEGLEGRRERIDAFMAFMVSISDQILVSQVAILIAAIIIHIEITIYSVNIVIALGCLASTVHLGSFPFYIDRLKEHGLARLTRVIAMIAGSGMLIFMLIIQLSSTWDMETHVYFICVMRDYRIDGDDVLGLLMQLFVPIAVAYSTYEIIRLLYKSQPKNDDTIVREHEDGRITSRSTMGGTTKDQQPTSDRDIEMQQPPLSHRQVMRHLDDQRSREPDRASSEIRSEVIILRQLLQPITEDETQHITHAGNTNSQQRPSLFRPRSGQYTLKHRLRNVFRQTSESRDRLLNKWLQLRALKVLLSDRDSQFRLKVELSRIAEEWAFHQCRGSFMWRFLWLWSGNVYAIVTVTIALTNDVGMSGDRNKMGFGQVVPLALLALPLFAAMQSNADYKEKVKSILRNRQDLSSSATLQTRNTRPFVATPLQSDRESLSPNDVDNIRYVKNMLRQRAEDMGYPYLYNWARAGELNAPSSLWVSAGCHAGLMFVFTTLLGWSMAYDTPFINLVLLLILLLLSCRRIIGLGSIRMALESSPKILEYLHNELSIESSEVGDHAQRMAEGRLLEEAGEDVQENNE
ncbi:hypothetical protein Forpe1208_v015805 [Fusarium oxysporum f. sp. rapae]|uniref:Uncharacterized protein n=1 Tax=Fusarium oxysporum f. sp. rapae TaxID=485398 RepID=A0A8J5NLA8_FUSOX|nr:hypothetical protein Forpe1208_v015805 [Fusarium oxysporum f. sp. rapae]